MVIADGEPRRETGKQWRRRSKIIPRGVQDSQALSWFNSFLYKKVFPVIIPNLLRGGAWCSFVADFFFLQLPRSPPSVYRTRSANHKRRCVWADQSGASLQKASGVRKRKKKGRTKKVEAASASREQTGNRLRGSQKHGRALGSTSPQVWLLTFGLIWATKGCARFKVRSSWAGTTNTQTQHTFSPDCASTAPPKEKCSHFEDPIIPHTGPPVLGSSSFC